MPFDQELRSLPHGPEFRFVEEILSLDPGVAATGRYTVSGEEPFLKGHFPGRPLWPGVIMIEAIAQLGGIIAQCDPTQPALADMRLTSVKNAKILGSVEPGAVLTIEASIEGRLGPLIQVKGSVCSGEEKLAQAIVMLGGSSA